MAEDLNQLRLVPRLPLEFHLRHLHRHDVRANVDRVVFTAVSVQLPAMTRKRREGKRLQRLDAERSLARRAQFGASNGVAVQLPLAKVHLVTMILSFAAVPRSGEMHLLAKRAHLLRRPRLGFRLSRHVAQCNP